jgi:hypothetical protein
MNRTGGTRSRLFALAGRDEHGMLLRFRVTRRRAFKAVLAALATILLAGQISNEISLRQCEQMTRDSTASVSADLFSRLNRHVKDKRLPGYRTSWLPRHDLRDDAPALLGVRSWWHPPLLVPGFEGEAYYPWAYAVPLRWPTPFVVRVAHGFAVDGQSGGTGIDYYIAFFGCATRIHRRSLTMF